jgi:proteic killer suppression protein
MPMDIFYQGAKLRELCCDVKKGDKLLGKRTGELVRKRIAYMIASDNLLIYNKLPRNMNGRPHALGGDRKDEYGVELDHPRRLVFRIHADPVQRLTDGSVDFSKVTAVLIVEVCDYH